MPGEGRRDIRKGSKPQPFTGNGRTQAKGKILGSVIKFLSGHDDHGQGPRQGRGRAIGDLPHQGKHRGEK